ncbi:MAG TPA: YueI family protein [Bacilli bacterium]|nr:YueI family protein [Bacilli bacterium]
MDDKVLEILERGIYGTPETKPDERRLFLSTIRERIFLALTKRQVIRKGMYNEVISLIRSKKGIRLYINGDIGYSFYANYVKEGSKHSVPFTVVAPEKPTPIGLVIATENQAVEEKKIFILDEFYEADMERSNKNSQT